MEQPLEHEKMQNSSMAAFWATILLIVLLITALNFVNSNSSNHHSQDEKTHIPVKEQPKPAGTTEGITQ